ncbi:hypothetical protein [Candidatus Lokiarchaeum ossiferum]|uniref:hypothetical protein n=1 Tax=Candidatus Lokiarchaeum ossiferum TaxID=2951803 RepID=UPI00352CC437
MAENNENNTTLSDSQQPETEKKSSKKQKLKKFQFFPKKRKWEENYDTNGEFISRSQDRLTLYSDYYGPIIEDKNGHKAGKFFFEEYYELGHIHRFGEFLLVLLFGIYFAYGGYNLYYLGGVVRDAYADLGLSLTTDYAEYMIFVLYIILIIIGIWILSLIISYIFVRIFAEIAGILMYMLVIIEIGLLILLYIKIDWEYNWIFMVAVVPNVLMLTFWYKKFKKAIYTIRMSSIAVAKQREILTPQITQTLWILVLGFFHIVTSLETFLDITPISGATFELQGKAIEVSKGWIYFGYTALFVFCVFTIYFVSQGMKMLMVHNWYRGGGSLGFGKAYGIIRKRWWGIMGYAFNSTLVHMVQAFRKMIKGEFGPQNIKECFTQTGEIIPTQVNALRTKKNTPWYERVWMSLNFYTLPAIVIENRLYHRALLRSLFLSIRDIPSRYIKASKVNVLFNFVKYALIIINGCIGALVGYTFASLYGFPEFTTYVITGLAVPVFIWVGGGTATLIVNDLNNTYITLLYIHTVDDLNNKEHFTLNELQKLKGDTSVVVEKPKWYQFKKKQQFEEDVSVDPDQK